VAEVRTIAVIGAGRAGRDIALAAAMGGYRTILEDLLPNALRRAEEQFRAMLDQGAGRLSPGDIPGAFPQLEFAGSVEEAARQADLVIEAVPEELESKIEIFTLLDKICRPGTILAGTLSSLSITEIARVTYRAGKCVGIRWANPDERNKPLQIIRGLETDDDTVAAATEVGRRIGREVVVVRDAGASLS